MLDKKKKRSSSSSSVAREDWPGHHQPPQQVSDRKTDLEKLYRGEARGEARGQTRGPGGQEVYWNGKLGGYQPQPGPGDQTEEFSGPVGEVEKFCWNDSVPGKQAPSLQETKAPGEQNPVRKPKLGGLREFQNFNDEEKLYLFSSVGGHTNCPTPAVKQNTEDKLDWSHTSPSANSQAALYRSYLQSYEASR